MRVDQNARAKTRMSIVKTPVDSWQSIVAVDQNAGAKTRMSIVKTLVDSLRALLGGSKLLCQLHSSCTIHNALQCFQSLEGTPFTPLWIKVTGFGENQIKSNAFSEMSIKQFDKLFDQLLARHNENKVYWKSLEADLQKSVAKLENHREQGTLFDQLEVQLVSCS